MTARDRRADLLRILVNSDSGGGNGDDAVSELRERLAGVDIVSLGDGRDLAELLAGPPPPDALGACGGDGTVSAVAAQAIELGVPLAVFPAGTLNHFANDLGIPTMDEAIDAVDAGDRATVDVAEIAGRVFVNNASIGAYPDVVDTRERFESRIGKWPALVLALVVVLRRGAPCVVDVDGQRRRLWFAFLGNCTYDRAGLLVPAGRSRLDDGVLDIRLVHADRKWARLRLIGSALVRRLDRCSVYEARTADRVTIRSHGGPLRLAADGETFDGTDFVDVVKRPAALDVFVAAQDTRGSGASASMP